MNTDPSSQAFWYGALFFLGAVAAATLHQSFRAAGDAGIARFHEKYPGAQRFAFWTRRWPTLCAALLLLWAGLFVGALTLWLPLTADIPLPYAIARWLGVLSGSLLAVHLIPVAVAESYSDRITHLFLPLVIVATVLLYPLATLTAVAERRLTALLRSLSKDANRPSSEDEIISLMDQAQGDDLEEAEREMIRSVFEFGDTVTREIMKHRVDIVSFDHAATIKECVERSKQSYFSRFPVHANSLDDIRGVVHVKDLLRSLSEGQGDQPVASLCNKVTFVPESMPIDELFRLLRAAHAQLAVVVDEYGGTAGLVAMEDIIEELVGEIHDEYDATENAIQTLSDGSYLVDAREPVYEINQALGIEIPEHDDYDSVGGFVFHELGQIPGPGEVIRRDRFELRIQTAMPNRIVNVRIIKLPAASD